MLPSAPTPRHSPWFSCRASWLPLLALDGLAVPLSGILFYASSEAHASTAGPKSSFDAAASTSSACPRSPSPIMSLRLASPLPVGTLHPRCACNPSCASVRRRFRRFVPFGNFISSSNSGGLSSRSRSKRIRITCSWLVAAPIITRPRGQCRLSLRPIHSRSAFSHTRRRRAGIPSRSRTARLSVRESDAWGRLP